MRDFYKAQHNFQHTPKHTYIPYMHHTYVYIYIHICSHIYIYTYTYTNLLTYTLATKHVTPSNCSTHTKRRLHRTAKYVFIQTSRRSAVSRTKCLYVCVCVSNFRFPCLGCWMCEKCLELRIFRKCYWRALRSAYDVRDIYVPLICVPLSGWSNVCCANFVYSFVLVHIYSYIKYYHGSMCVCVCLCEKRS